MTRRIVLAFLLSALSDQAIRAEWKTGDTGQWNARGASLQAERRFAEAEHAYRRALALCEAGSPSCEQPYAVLNNLGSLYIATERYGEAEPLLAKAVSLTPPGPDLALALQNLATVHRAQARYPEAALELERSLALRPLDQHASPLWNTMAQVYRDMGQYAKAESAARRSLQEIESERKTETAEHATALIILGQIAVARGDDAGGRELTQHALDIRLRLLGPDDPLTADAWNDIAYTYRRQNRLAEAEELYRRALAVYIQHPGSRKTAVTTNNLANVLLAGGRWKDAVSLDEQAIARWEKTLGPEHPEVAAGLTNLAAAYEAGHQFGKAEPLLRRAVAIDLARYGQAHPRYALDLANLATLSSRRKHYSEAEELLTRSVSILEAALPSGHVDIGTTVNNLAETCRIQGRDADAIRYYRKGISILSQAWEKDDIRLLGWLDRYSSALRAQKEFAEAAKVDAQAMRIRVVRATH